MSKPEVGQVWKVRLAPDLFRVLKVTEEEVVTKHTSRGLCVFGREAWDEAVVSGGFVLMPANEQNGPLTGFEG